jgi:exoribonuclease-2
MEHYWCLRWLQQENVAESEATVVRENLVRFDGLPLYVRAPDLPALTPGTRVRVGVGRIDLLAATLDVRFIGAA